MAKLHVSLKLSKDVAFPIDIAGQAIAMFGIRGSGKTNTAGALAEELLDQNYPIAVIDPTDAWWGLRAGRDGSQAGGYQVFIFGGSHADLALSENDGKTIAEFLVREQVPVILSLRHLRKAAQRRFVTEFCEELYHLKGKDENRTPLTVFIDEAPLFIPQKVIGEVARTVGAVEDLIARGRNSGFGVVLISQRSATLNADVRTQADTIICHRVTSPLDRRAISDWFEENATTDDLKTILQSLATLRNGEAWVWSPALDIMKRAQIRLRRTFDSSATPKAGAKLRPPKRLADVDLEKLKGQLAAAIERQKADDPKELRRRIAELERELKAKPAAAPPAPEVKKVEVSILTADDRKLLSRVEVAAGRHSEEWNVLTAKLAIAADRIARATSIQPSQATPLRVVNGTGRHAPGREALGSGMPKPGRVPLHPAPVTGGDDDVRLGRCERALLIALAQRHPARSSANQVAILSGYSLTSSGFQNALSKLRTALLIDGSGASMSLTPDGLALAGEVPVMPTGMERVSFWQNKLGRCEAAVLAVLAKAYPEGVERSAVAEQSGYSETSSGFQNALSKLRTLELIDGKMGQPLRARQELFD